MRIDSIDLYHVAMPLRAPWRAAYGEDSVVESLVVRMQSAGAEAWGESTPLAAPCYSAEWAGGAFSLARDWLAPRLVGQSIESGEALQARLAIFKGNPFAKAALDNTWWVLAALLADKPLHTFLGAARDSIEVGEDFGVQDSVGQLIEQVGRAFAAGFSRVKLKFRPDWGIEMLRAVRQAFPSQRLHIDMNAGYRFEQTDLLTRLDDFSLAMLEQPLAADDLIDHARLQTLLRTPICLDESLSSPERAQLAVDLGSCRLANLKPGRVGGLTPALAMLETFERAGIGCWVGGMLESGLGARIALALATRCQEAYPHDLFESAKFYADDLADPPVALDRDATGQPTIRALNAPGIGTHANAERLARWTRQHARLVS